MLNSMFGLLLMLISTVFLVNIPGSCLAETGAKINIINHDMPLEKLAAELTEGQQSETEADLEITRKIRQAIANDKSLSNGTHNVNIITFGGKVKLKGSLKSVQEIKTIERIATEIAGSSNVINEIITSH